MLFSEFNSIILTKYKSKYKYVGINLTLHWHVVKSTQKQNQKFARNLQDFTNYLLELNIFWFFKNLEK